MQTDLDDNDDMPLDTSGDQALDEKRDDGIDPEASFAVDMDTDVDTDDMDSKEAGADDDGAVFVLKTGVSRSPVKEDVIHSDVRRALEAMRESRQLQDELSDEFDDFDEGKNFA